MFLPYIFFIIATGGSVCYCMSVMDYYPDESHPLSTSIHLLNPSNMNNACNSIIDTDTNIGINSIESKKDFISFSNVFETNEVTSNIGIYANRTYTVTLDDTFDTHRLMKVKLPDDSKVKGRFMSYYKTPHVSAVTLDMLIQDIICTDNTGAVSWSPFTWKGGVRGKSNFHSAQAVVFDMDNKPEYPVIEYESAMNALFEIGICTNFSYQSFSSTDDCPRYRIVIFLSEIITDVDVYKQIVDIVYKSLLFKLRDNPYAHKIIDSACVYDWGRIYYPGKALLGEVSYKPTELATIHDISIQSVYEQAFIDGNTKNINRDVKNKQKKMTAPLIESVTVRDSSVGDSGIGNGLIEKRAKMKENGASLYNINEAPKTFKNDSFCDDSSDSLLSTITTVKEYVEGADDFSGAVTHPLLTDDNIALLCTHIGVFRDFCDISNKQNHDTLSNIILSLLFLRGGYEFCLCIMERKIASGVYRPEKIMEVNRIKARIKNGDLKPPLLQNFSPYSTDGEWYSTIGNALTTLHLRPQVYKELTCIEVASKEPIECLDRCISNAESGLVQVFMTPTGWGKTEYLVKNVRKNSVICCKTHKLKNELVDRYEQDGYHRFNFYIYPELPTFFDDKWNQLIKDKYAEDMNEDRWQEVQIIIDDIIEYHEDDARNSDRLFAENYKAARNAALHAPEQALIIGTHHAGLLFDFKQRNIIFDECPGDIVLRLLQDGKDVNNMIKDTKNITILSTTPDVQALKALFPERLRTYNFLNMKMKGIIIQYLGRSGSKTQLARDIESIKLIIKLHAPNLNRITFKALKDELEIEIPIHYGAVEGHDSLKGQDLFVIGKYTRPLHAIINELNLLGYNYNIPIKDGKVDNDALMREYGYKKRDFTFDGVLFTNQHLPLDDIIAERIVYYQNREAVQALGRSRGLREDVTMFHYGNTPLTGLNIVYTTSLTKFVSIIADRCSDDDYTPDTH